jgi:hypothetical protein
VVVVEAGVGELGEGVGGANILSRHNFTSFLSVCICAEWNVLEHDGSVDKVALSQSG